jgi:uncharacterized protein (TIGR00266 family)
VHQARATSAKGLASLPEGTLARAIPSLPHLARQPRSSAPKDTTAAAAAPGVLPVAGSPFQPFVWSSNEQAGATPFAIIGDSAQLLQITLAPGASVKAEPGAIAFCSDGIAVDTKLDGGLLQSLSRVVAGESLFTNTLTNAAQTPGFVALHPSATQAKIVPLDLNALGGAMLCQRDAFLASLGAVSVSAQVTRRLSAGLLGGEGFILQKLEGSGLAFITAAGTLVQKMLAPGETVCVDAGCLVAMQPSIDFSAAYVGSLRRALFAGEGAFMARLNGGASGGLVVLQSVREHGTGNTSGSDRNSQSHRCVRVCRYEVTPVSGSRVLHCT